VKTEYATEIADRANPNPSEVKGDALTEAYMRGREVGTEIAEKKLKDLQKQLADATFKIIDLERKLMGAARDKMSVL